MLKVLSALLAGGILSGTAYAQSPIVHDGEYNFLRAEHGEKWDQEDKLIDKKLADNLDED